MPNPKLETYKNKATGTVYDYTDAAAQAALAGILDGTDIDSFGDVETALATKVDKVTGKGLSTNDYDNTAKGIVDNIQSNVIANTKLIKDTVGWSGKNLLDTSIILKLYIDTTTMKYASQEDPYVCVAKVEPNTKYIITKQAGTHFRVATSQNYPADNVAYTSTYADHTGTEIQITTGANDHYIGVYTDVSDFPTAMVRDADILDDTYEPYFGSTAFPRSEQAVLGAKNLFSPQIGIYDNGGGTHSEADGVITVNTTTTENSGSYFSRTSMRNYFADKPKQGWILSFDYKSDISCAGYIGLENVAQMPTEWTHYSKEIADITQIDFVSLYNKDTTKTPVIQAKHFMFSFDGGEYVPYAMTNKELTDFAKHTKTILLGTNSSYTFTFPDASANGNVHACFLALMSSTGGLEVNVLAGYRITASAGNIKTIAGAATGSFDTTTGKFTITADGPQRTLTIIANAEILE